MALGLGRESQAQQQHCSADFSTRKQLSRLESLDGPISVLGRASLARFCTVTLTDDTLMRSMMDRSRDASNI